MTSATRSAVLLALALIAFGGALLMQLLGYLPTSLWAALLSLWPVLLVALGLRMGLGPHKPWGIMLSAALTTLALLWAVFSVRIQTPGSLHTLTQYIGNAESTSISLDLTTARLNVSALDGTALLLEGGALTAPGETIEQSYFIADQAGQLKLTQHLDSLAAPFLDAPDVAPRWDIRLTPQLPLALEVRAGAGVLVLDLASTQLTRLNLRADSAETTIIFPAHAATAEIRTTSGNVRLTLPAGVPTRLTLAALPDRLQIPPFLFRDGNVFTTPGFTPARDFLDLHVVTDTGRVTVD